MSDRQWYYAPAGSHLGPVSAQELRRLLSAGQVPASAPVWCEGMADWQPAGQVPEFKAALPPAGGAMAPTPPQASPYGTPHGQPGHPPAGYAPNYPPGYGGQPGQPPLGYYAPPPGYPPAHQDEGTRWLVPVGRSGWAIAAGYAGLLSLVPFFAPIALILAFVALSHLKKNPQLHGKGRAIFGLVMGSLFSVLLLVMLMAMAA